MPGWGILDLVVPACAAVPAWLEEAPVAVGMVGICVFNGICVCKFMGFGNTISGVTIGSSRDWFKSRFAVMRCCTLSRDGSTETDLDLVGTGRPGPNPADREFCVCLPLDVNG